jgi:hypothetical protein
MYMGLLNALVDPEYYSLMGARASGLFNSVEGLPEYDQGYDYGTILPFKKNMATGDVSLAAPGLLKDAARAFTAPGKVFNGELDPNVLDANNIALNLLGLGSGASTATKTGVGKGDLGIFAGVL